MKKKILFISLVITLCLTAVLTMSFKTENKTDSNECITKSFAAYEDGECIATFDLYSNCTFLYVNKEEHPYQRIRGTYEMEEGPIEKGCYKRITIYVDGVSADRGVLAWPLQQELVLIMGEFDFYPVN